MEDRLFYCHHCGRLLFPSRTFLIGGEFPNEFCEVCAIASHKASIANHENAIRIIKNRVGFGVKFISD